MGNLLTSMYVGVSGLRLNQAGVNTTAHNLANVDTPGYVRQQNLSVDFGYNTIGYTANSYMQVGLGTDMAIVRQVRDVFLDKAYRLEIGRQSFYEAQNEAVDEVQTLFGELEGVAFQETVMDFQSALKELAKEPDDIVKRTALMEVGSTFIARATVISDQLNKYQTSLNTKILNQVKRINEIGDQIKELNNKICSVESGPEQANDYRDARNLLLDELGQYAKISYKEEINGKVTINLEGVQFLNDDYVSYLGTEPIDDTTSMLKVVWARNGGGEVFDLNSSYSTAKNTDIGSLKGLLIARGSKVANYTDIPNKDSDEFYDIDADGNRTFIEASYQLAVKKYNDTVGSSVIMSVQAQFDQLFHGIITTMNDTLSPNDTLENVMKSFNNEIGSNEIAYSTVSKINDQEIRYDIVIDENGKTTTKFVDGVQAGDSIFDERVNIYNVKVWDEYNSPIGMDENNTSREVLFNRKNTERYTKATISCSHTDEDGNVSFIEKDIWVYNDEDPTDKYSLFTVGETEVNDILLKDPSVIPLSGNQYQGRYGAYDIGTCEKIVDMWRQPFATLNPNILTKSDFSDYYVALIGDIANKGSVNASIISNQKQMTNGIDDQRQQVAGVSSDEELSNMIMYQHAYNANSRYITVVDQMLEHLINKLG